MLLILTHRRVAAGKRAAGRGDRSLPGRVKSECGEGVAGAGGGAGAVRACARKESLSRALLVKGSENVFLTRRCKAGSGRSRWWRSGGR